MRGATVVGFSRILVGPTKEVRVEISHCDPRSQLDSAVENPTAGTECTIGNFTGTLKSRPGLGMRRFYPNVTIRGFLPTTLYLV